MSTSSTSTPSSPAPPSAAILPSQIMETAESGGVPPVVKVSQRASLSCTECTRRKIKCDKMIPCQTCKKRGRTHLCCVPVHVRKPTTHSRKKASSPPVISSAPLPTPPATTSSLPLPLPFPLPPPPPPLSSIDPSILHPLYSEIDRLRGIVDTLQSRVHGLEGILSYVLPQQPPIHPTSTSSAPPRPDGDAACSAMMTPMPSPPQGYTFHPHVPYYPLPPAPSVVPEHQTHQPHPSKESDSDPSASSSALRLSNLTSNPLRYPLPMPTIPPSSSRAPTSDYEIQDPSSKRRRIDPGEAEAETIETTRAGENEAEEMGQSSRGGTINRRPSSTLDKLLSPPSAVEAATQIK